MEKDYARWHQEKARLNGASRPQFFREREVWWCLLGANIGDEQDGDWKEFARPVVILKKFNLDACLIVPLTGKRKEGAYYLPLGVIDGREASAILSQIRFIDARRLARKMTILDKAAFLGLSRAVVRACFPDLES